VACVGMTFISCHRVDPDNVFALTFMIFQLQHYVFVVVKIVVCVCRFSSLLVLFFSVHDGVEYSPYLVCFWDKL